MLSPGSQVTIWLYTGVTDMRKSFNGLSALVRNELGGNPVNGDLYVFMNRRKTLMKIIYFDNNGYAIWSKRLEQGQFVTHRLSDQTHAIGMAELHCLIDGIDIRKSRKYKRFSLERRAA